MPPVTYRGSKSRAEDVGSVSLKQDGKRYLLRAGFQEDVPAAVVKRLKSPEFSGHNFDFDSSKED